MSFTCRVSRFQLTFIETLGGYSYVIPGHREINGFAGQSENLWSNFRVKYTLLMNKTYPISRIPLTVNCNFQTRSTQFRGHRDVARTFLLGELLILDLCIQFSHNFPPMKNLTMRLLFHPINFFFIFSHFDAAHK